MRVTNTEIITFLLVFFRTSAILLTAPFFGSKSIAFRIKILLSCVVSLVLIMSLYGRGLTPLRHIQEAGERGSEGAGERGSEGARTRSLTPTPPRPLNISGRRSDTACRVGTGATRHAVSVQQVLSQGTIGISLAILRELLLGIGIGFTAQLTFAGIQLAGQFVGYGMGFGMMRIMDPSTRTNVTITAQYNMVVATLIFLLIHGHHYILMGIAKSFSAIPLAQWVPSASFIGHLNTVFAGIFTSALRIAIPVMGALFLTKVAMGILARTMPQMNVFIVGFPIQISIGLIAMAISLPFFVKILYSLFTSMRENVFLIFDF